MKQVMILILFLVGIAVLLATVGYVVESKVQAAEPLIIPPEYSGPMIAPPSVATCDQTSLFKDSKAISARVEQLRKDSAVAKQQAAARTKQAQDLQAKLDEKKEGSKKYNAIFQELAVVNAENKVWLDTENKKLIDTNKAIVDTVTATIKVVAENQKVDLVLKTSDTLYASESLDITKSVVAELDKDALQDTKKQ